ncbi:nuclear pore complex protein NUP50A-like [Amaranthus tricolor]|uniref:nuclear pore complex protein NUP50A-like n=1 Tax=Amaranthus tricolor TaxID=29722 RepID=UPI00258854C4|nr:nuclear pore complex protein NUP50A-like [Amaranthus tricolor]
MGDENQPSKKRAAGRELSRDNPGVDDEEEVDEQATGTFKKATEEVLATRRIVKVRRQPTPTAPSAPSSNPFAGIRLVPPAPAPAKAQAAEDKTSNEDAITKNANTESEVNKVESEEKTNEDTTEANAADPDNKVPTEQVSAVTQPDDTVDKAAELKPNDEVGADSNSEKAVEGETAVEKQAEGDVVENDDTNENEIPVAGGNSSATLSSFQQLSNSQNAFTGLAGTGFSSSTFSFGSSLQKDGSPSQSSLPTFSFGASNNGSTSLFGSVPTGTSIGTKTENPVFRSMPEVPTETGEENEETVFSTDSALFEYLDGGWKERGKGEVKVNVMKGDAEKARLVMRAKGNLRLILNACLFPDMKLTKMDKRGVTFACVNIAMEGKDGLSTFALKFKDGTIMDEFSSAVSVHKGTSTTATAPALKTPENSPKASDD